MPGDRGRRLPRRPGDRAHGGPSHDTVDSSAALAGYEAIRTLRTARVQRTARVWGDIWHVDRLARQLRNELFADRRSDDFKHVDWLYDS